MLLVRIIDNILVLQKSPDDLVVSLLLSDGAIEIADLGGFLLKDY